MSAASHQPATTTHNPTGVPPVPPATRQDAVVGEVGSRVVEMNGSRILMAWDGAGWVNRVMGPALFTRIA